MATTQQPEPVVFARLTVDGTAIAESAVCGRCLPAATPDQLAFLDTDDAVGGHVDCSGNEALSCQLCGTAP